MSEQWLVAQGSAHQVAQLQGGRARVHARMWHCHKLKQTHSSNHILQSVLLNKIYVSEWTFKNNVTDKMPCV